jgi:predicted phosphodiesterase
MLRIIGDVHQVYNKYYDIVKKAEQDDVLTLQLGDMGFDYTFLRLNLDPNNDKFFKGNHDNYDEVDTYNEGYNIGNYGVCNHGGTPFYFIRGGFSIDWAHRVAYDEAHGTKCWWDEEELSMRDMQKCFAEYSAIKPDILITHEPCRTVAKLAGNPNVLSKFGYDPDTFTTATSELIEECIKVHKPKLVVSGHFHLHYDEVVDGVRHVIIPTLGTFDLPENL